MKILAKVFPNKKYIYYNNLEKIHIEARLENNQVSFYEVNKNKKEILLQESFIHSLLIDSSFEKQPRDIPWPISTNDEFLIILFRKKHPEIFQKLKQKVLNE
jgi:hypothetical protein